MIKNECAFYGESLAGARASGLEESYQGLITAVIRQAVKDYVSVLLRLFSCPAGKKKAALEMEKAELEVFFHSDWFHTLTDMDGERLLLSARRLAMEKAMDGERLLLSARRLAMEKAKEAIRRKQKKKFKDMGAITMRR